MKNFVRIALVCLMLVLFASVSMGYERSETLVYGGGLWETPSNWNPLTPWAEVTGTGGLVYETLFHFYPMTGEYQPWLASSGKWISNNTYEIELRKGIKWTDGQAFDAEDVKFTFEIAKKNRLHYSNVWDWIKEIKIINPHKLQFVFKNPHYQEWELIIYDLRIIPEHIWGKIPASELLTTANKNPVGTGAYMAEFVGQDRMVWVRNENWWGNKVFGEPQPKYLVNLVVYENNVALGMLMKRELDISNYFIPGVPKIKNTFGLTTWYKDIPYMLPENTALLFLNSTKGAMKDVEFRRALAFAINPAMITNKVFEDQVEEANPTGLFSKDWMDFYSEEAVKEYGFSYNPEKVKEMLDAAGYKDTNKDGWREQPNGEPMKFEIIVPNGWTDWMESIKIIADNFKAVGINAIASFPDYSIYYDKLQNGTFDMAINNFGSAQSATPFTYWNWVANDEIDGKIVTDGNWGRYKDKELFRLIDEFNVLKSEDPAAKKAAAEIQKKLLQEMPSIPLWYNGLWAQSTSTYWTNWPTEDNPVGYPCTWAGKWWLGSVEMLINLKPVE